MDDGAGDVPEDDRILDYEELLAGAEPAEFAVEDENQAAAMCYTSGTTGHPKGVVYSHRSSVLHSIGAMLADTVAVSERDVVMPVVPMFHANAWGLAHAGVMAGSAFAFPGPQMTPKAIAQLMEDEKVTLAAGVPTIWMGALDELEGRDTLGAAGDPVRRLGGPEGAVGGLPREARPADPARLGHDRDEPARLRLPDQEHARRTAPRRSSPTCAPPRASSRR